MNKTAHLISDLEALFTSHLKIADAHGLDTLPMITTARARTLLMQIRAAKHEAKRENRTPAYFNRLDEIHA
jgi:hypothetical protein